ncbi:MAG: hypothetical protein QXH03_03020 [Candidatus Bathyarchaeia archaeon]
MEDVVEVKLTLKKPFYDWLASYSASCGFQDVSNLLVYVAREFLVTKSRELYEEEQMETVRQIALAFQAIASERRVPISSVAYEALSKLLQK